MCVPIVGCGDMLHPAHLGTRLLRINSSSVYDQRPTSFSNMVMAVSSTSDRPIWAPVPVRSSWGSSATNMQSDIMLPHFVLFKQCWAGMHVCQAANRAYCGQTGSAECMSGYGQLNCTQGVCVNTHALQALYACICIVRQASGHAAAWNIAGKVFSNVKIIRDSGSIEPRTHCNRVLGMDSLHRGQVLHLRNDLHSNICFLPSG